MLGRDEKDLTPLDDLKIRLVRVLDDYLKVANKGRPFPISLNDRYQFRLHYYCGPEGIQRAENYKVKINSVTDYEILIRTVLADLKRTNDKQKNESVLTKTFSQINSMVTQVSATLFSSQVQPLPSLPFQFDLGNSEMLASHIAEALCRKLGVQTFDNDMYLQLKTVDEVAADSYHSHTLGRQILAIETFLKHYKPEKLPEPLKNDEDLTPEGWPNLG